MGVKFTNSKSANYDSVIMSYIRSHGKFSPNNILTLYTCTLQIRMAEVTYTASLVPRPRNSDYSPSIKIF